MVKVGLVGTTFCFAGGVRYGPPPRGAPWAPVAIVPTNSNITSSSGKANLTGDFTFIHNKLNKKTKEEEEREARIARFKSLLDSSDSEDEKIDFK